MGLLYGREIDGGYKPSLWHRLFEPRISGNTLNGLNEGSVRRPTPLYHRQDYWHPWRMVQDMFYIRQTLHGQMLPVLKSVLLDKKGHVPVSEKRIERTPEEWSKRIKDYARSVGIDKVGITRIEPEWIFERDELPETYAIILATRMDYESLYQSVYRRFSRVISEVMSIYYYGHVRAKKVANWLRSQGWEARGFGSPMGSPLNLVQAAIAAGIGELGKHGSLICREMGALLRLSYVVTDIPLALDAPIDIGVDDFCLRCNVCTSECPPQAISNEKQLVRGVKRWYVDFDKCVPYFSEHQGCGLCLAVCPWSQPGVAENITRKMMKLRGRKSRSR